MYAEPLTEQPQSLNENGTRYYSDLEEILISVDLLIDELTEAALEAIELAAGEAARAAFMASLEREAAALREAQRWRLEAETVRQAGIKNSFLVGAVCFIGGLVVGVFGTLAVF